MKCTKIENLLIDYIEENLNKEESLKVQKHIDSCVNCKKEVEEMKLFLGVLENDSEEMPSNNLKLNFNAFLEQEKQQTKIVQLQPKNEWKTYLRVAASILLVVSAFLIGKYNSNLTHIANNQTKKEKEILAMFNNQSASKRIQAIDLSENFTKTDHKIIDALINKLFNDKNVNVRLAAAEALSKFSSLEKVKAALIKSLETEKTPSMQIEIIQILAKNSRKTRA